MPETKFQKEIRLFLFFLGISVLIWLMIKLSNTYYDTLTVKIDYVNLPDKNTIISKSDKQLKVLIKAKGFKLIGLVYFSSKPKIDINLREIQLHKSRYSYESFVLTQPIVNSIINQLDMPDEVVSISPDTLFLTLENITKRSVPIVPKIDYTLKKQYQLYGNMSVNPDSVVISGPPSMIDTIIKINTAAEKIHNISSDITVKKELIKPIKSDKLFLATDSVEITIPVEKFTEETQEIPIEVEGIQRDRIKLFPEDVKITYLLALKDFDKINKNMFKARVNFTRADKSIQKLDIEVVQAPNNIKITQITPEKVEFLLLKK